MAGYYDDFNNARGIANDNNEPTLDGTYDHTKTHYGNPLNGEAINNPKFRWSYVERAKGTNYDSDLIGSSDETKLLHNKGGFEWLSFDSIRLGSEYWEGRSQLQYPDSHISNKYKYAASGTDGYLLITNGNDTLGKYVIPTGLTDSSFGRGTVTNYTVTNYEASAHDAGGHGDVSSGGAAGDFVQRAHLAGVWLGETTTFAHKDGGTVESPRNIFTPVRSPGGKPFLCVQSYHKVPTSRASVPAVIYDGTLNSRMDGDIFTVRYAVRSFNGETANEGKQPPIVTLKLGYASGPGSTLQNGNTGTPEISWSMNFSTGNGLKDSNYDYYDALYENGTTKSTYTVYDAWIDVDFVMDYTNGKYKVYHDGTEITATNDAAGAYSSGYAMNSGAGVTPSNMYGWEMEAYPNTGDNSVSITLMLDRVALYRPLSDHPDGTILAPIKRMKIDSRVDGFSSCRVEIYDDPSGTGSSVGTSTSDYSHNLTTLFSGSSIDDWLMLVFVGDPTTSVGKLDRPIWKGVIEKMEVSQEERDRVIELRCTDMLSLLDRSIPLWEIGQAGLNDNETSTDFWLQDAQGFNSVMYLGAKPLSTLGNTVGFDVDDSYSEMDNQRTQLGSGHPIQIYNNENETYGPNSIEEQYEGTGIVKGGIGQVKISTTAYTSVEVNTTTGFSASDNVTISRTTSHNATSSISPFSVTTDAISGNQVLNFAQSDLAFTASAARILYAGKYKFVRFGVNYFKNSGFNDIIKDAILANYPSSSDPQDSAYTTFAFSADPGLSPGDVFQYVPYNGTVAELVAPNGYAGKHQVKSIEKIHNYYTTPSQAYIWVVDTYTPCNASETTGTYTSKTGLLSGNDRGKMCSDFGIVSLIPTSLDKDITHRAVHARWMRDLPLSLWFQYHYGITETPNAYLNGNIAATILAGATEIRVGSSGTPIATDTWNAIPSSGIAEIQDTGKIGNPSDKFIYRGKYQSGADKYLIGCQYISRQHATTYSEAIGTPLATKIKIPRISNDYKHLYILWSDMRNNGYADADGMGRTTDFGLMFPVADNYEVSLYYADQDVDYDGQLDKFAELKIGEDVDVWSLDATSDPASNIAWSKPGDFSNPVTVSSLADSSGKLRINTSTTTNVVAGDYIHLFGTASHNGGHLVDSVSAGAFIITTTTYSSSSVSATGGAFYCRTTGTDQDLSQYQDWENKGGAFVIIDSSKFFNLNTLANGGKVGLYAGARTDLSDYVATISGYPSLLDNYYAEAMSSYKTTAGPYAQHPNQRWVLNDIVVTNEDIKRGQFYLQPESTTDFADSGEGRIIGVSGDGGRAQVSLENFYTYQGKLGTAVTGTLSGMVLNDSDDDWTLTHTGQTFITKNVKAGMFIKNTTTPITTAMRGQVNNFFRIKEVVSETQLKVEQVYFMAYNSAEEEDNEDEGGNPLYYDQESADYNLEGLNVKAIAASVSADVARWSNGENYSIPIQLYGVFSTSASVAGIEKESTPIQIRDSMFETYENSSEHDKCVQGSFLQSGYDSVGITTTIAPPYMLRLMMKLSGYAKSVNSGTYYDSDKFRSLWSAALLDNWMPPTRLNTVFDINNVPYTGQMTTYNSTTNNDKYGSMVDSRGKTIWKTMKEIQKKSGIGDENGLTTSFSYLVGRDGRLEYRPKYNSGHALNRSNLMISDLSTDVSGRVSHVRVYYRNGLAFVDFPTAAIADTTRWKIVEKPEINSDIEAIAVAKQTYNTIKNARLSISASPIRATDSTDKMLTHGRYGYISDPQRAIQGRDDYTSGAAYGRAWTRLGTGGVPFPGMVNAINGHMDSQNSIYDRYGESKQPVTSSTATWNNFYYWYGSNSVSHAVQIVHVPKKCPLDSDGTSEDLRVAVWLKTGQSGTDIDNAEFTIGLLDYSFSTSSSAKGGAAPTLVATLSGSSTVDVKNSGYYEILVPSTYSSSLNSAGAKFVVSFNAEYCRALLRRRCGAKDSADLLKNAHDVTGITTFPSYNTKSIFPLGVRKYTEMSSFADDRSEWYAPRLQVVYDLNYIPATYVSYTDAGLNLNAESMVIQNVSWVVNDMLEDVTLGLERDMSLSSGGVIPYLFSDKGGLQGSATGSKLDHNWNPVGGEQGGSSPVGDYKPSGTAIGGTPENDTDMPEGGGNPFKSFAMSGRTGGGGASTSPGFSSNQLSKALWGTVKGRMSVDGDQYSNQGEFSILGQKKPGTTPSSMKPIEGLDVSVYPSRGAASVTADGFALSASTGTVEETSSNISEVMCDLTIPADVINNEFVIHSTISLAPKAKHSKTAVLYVNAKCLETGKNVSNTIQIPTNTERTNIEILPTTLLSGVSTPGNHLQVKISRNPAKGNDDASNYTLVLHDLRVGIKRAAFLSEAVSNQFKIQT
tara:strand:+ start:901 stop:7992 length:7092 start_codon:yes stop_codon:yes gene_type:complete